MYISPFASYQKNYTSLFFAQLGLYVLLLKSKMPLYIQPKLALSDLLS